MKYKKLILVRKQGLHGDKWLQAEEEAENFVDGEMAVYEFKRLVKKGTKAFLIAKKQ
jgi:hypothetical protein